MPRGDSVMYDIGALLDARFVRHLLNELSISLAVQCALLDEHGRVFMRAGMPAPPNGLPYDISLALLRAGILDSRTRKKWARALRDTIAKARNSHQAQAIQFPSDGLKWVQCLAPLIVGKFCIGFISSGKIPFGDKSSPESISKVFIRKVRRSSQEKLAKALRSTGILPKARIKDHLLMVTESARAASRIAAQNLQSSGIAELSTVKARSHVEALDDVIRAINRGDDEDSILHVIIRKGFKLLGADRGTLHIWDSSQNMLVITAVVPEALSAKVRGFAHPVDEGICGWVFRKKKPALVHDLKTEKEWSGRYLRKFHRLFPKPRTRSELAVPLLTSGGATGVLNVESGQPNAFADEHVEILETLANHAVVALHRADLLRAKERQLQAFANTISKLGPQYSLSDTLGTIVQQAAIALGGSVGNLKLYDERSAALLFRAICSYNGKKLKWDVPFRVWVQEGGPEDSVSAWVFRNRQARLTPDTQKEDLWNTPPWPARSGVHVPLLAGKRPVGVLAVDNPTPNAFTNSDLRVLELLATEVAVTVENAWHDELMRSIGSLLTHTLEVPMDEESGKHRISILSRLAMIVWEVMKPKACSVIVLPGSNEDPRFMRIPDGCEYGIDRTAALPLPEGKGLYGAAIRSGRIQESKNVMRDKRFADTALAKSNRLFSALSVPIRKDGQPYGALNYYSSFERDFSEFERYSIEAVCGIAGMIISATEAETLRRRTILDQIGTGVTLIGVPPDWEKRKLKRKKGNTLWNLDIRMPILFLNRIHDEIFSPKAKRGMDCYKAFNDPAQRRPCWWCPTIRAISSGQDKTSFTHSPAPPKNRIEHFKVTASILKESGKPVAAIESTVPATRELEGRNLSTRLLETDDDDEVFGLAAECLGRGTRNDCLLIIPLDENSKDPKVNRIYTVDREVLKQERAARPEWRKDTLSDNFPPFEEYFAEREQKGHRLFKKRLRHIALRKSLSPYAKKIISKTTKSGKVFVQIPTKKLLEFFRGTTLLSETHFRNCHKERPPRAVILRIGSQQNPLACVVMLDKKPGWPCFEEPGHGRHWCIEVASELATKIESIRFHRNMERLARFREAIIEQAPVGVLVTDDKGTVKRVNRAWRNMAGGNITGRNLFSIDSVRRANLVVKFREALRGKQVQFEQSRFRTVFGRELVLSVKCVPMFRDKNRVSGLLVMCWDMTDVAKKYEELINRHELLLLGNLAAGTTHEVKHSTITANHAISHIAGAISCLLQIESRLSRLKLTRGDWLRLCKFADKSLLWVKPNATPLGDPYRKDTGRMSKLLLQRNLQYNDTQVRTLARLGATNELSLLLSRCCDRLVKPIFSYTMELATVVTFCNIANQSITHIREIARSLSMQTFIAPQRDTRVDIHDTINAALIILSRELVKDENEILIQKRYSRAIPEFRCSPSQLTQLWRNIIMNSIDSIRKARRRGRILISTCRKGKAILITFKDNGFGIPERVDLDSLGMSLPILEEKATVHGYGFWTIKRIIESHSGSLRIERLHPSPGTAIRIRLPIKNT